MVVIIIVLISTLIKSYEIDYRLFFMTSQTY